MNRITFCGGESTGGVADRKIETAKQETTGGVGVRASQPDPDVKINSLERDTVSFRASAAAAEKSSASLMGILSTIGFSAVALIGGLGCAKKYNWVDKISNQKTKDFVLKYAVDPCYNVCKSVKKFCVDNYNKITAKK